MSEVMRADVTTQVIVIEQLAALVRDNRAGAVVVFSGDVRTHDGGKEVLSLTYEIHPTAHEQIAFITTALLNGRDVVKVALSHRYGEIAIGETAFGVAVSAEHREAAFETCSALVDEIKAKLPIWKHQRFTDGSDEWVNTA
ncbi:MAG: molybdenum cofactor biosynthesis protein MoaE [Candidatus Planktophila sp.]|nr:molybdenum cofactor biosynthesis protein MoaE [Candidatus Planktophila sp.]